MFEIKIYKYFLCLIGKKYMCKIIIDLFSSYKMNFFVKKMFFRVELDFILIFNVF